MKRILFLLPFLLVLLSCKKKEDLVVNNSVPEDKPPEVTERYYFQAKCDSTWKTLQYTSTPLYESAEGITFSFYTGASGHDHYDVNINLPDSLPTEELINSLEGKRIYFDSLTSRNPEIRLIENDILYSSSFVCQNGASMIIYDVTPDGSYQDRKCFLLQGFFNCRIATVSGQGIRVLSQGKFGIRVVEK